MTYAVCCFFLLHNLIYVSNRGNLHNRTVFVHLDSDFILFWPSQKYVWSWLKLKFLKIFILFSNKKGDSKCVVPNSIMYSEMDRVIVISSPLEWKLEPKNELKPDVKLTVGCHQHCYCNICQIILNVLNNFTNFMCWQKPLTLNHLVRVWYLCDVEVNVLEFFSESLNFYVYYFDSITVPYVESLTEVNLFQVVHISFSLNTQDLHKSRRRTAHNVMWKSLVTIYFCVIVFIKKLM